MSSLWFIADIGAVQKGKFEKIVVGTHQFINKYLPFVWGFIYRFGHYVILPFRVTIAGFNYQSTKALVDQYHPDIIIATQTAASAVVAAPGPDSDPAASRRTALHSPSA